MTTYTPRPERTEHQRHWSSFRQPMRDRLAELLAAGVVPDNDADLLVLATAADFDESAQELFDVYLVSEREKIRQRGFADMRPTKLEALSECGMGGEE